MKKISKVIALILALVFILSAFAGCKNEEEETGPQFTYVPEYHEIPIDIGDGYINRSYYSNGKVYVIANMTGESHTVTLEETGESWEEFTYVQKLFSMNPDGTELYEYTDFTLGTGEYKDNSGSNTNIGNIFSAGDKLFAMKSSESWSSDPETGAYTSDSSNYLCEIDSTGKFINEKLLYESHYDDATGYVEDAEAFTPSYIFCNADATKWYLADYDTVKVCDAELNEIFSLEQTEINSFFLMSDGRAAVSTYGDTGLVYKILDEEAKTLGESQPLPLNWWDARTGNSEYPIISSNENGVYGLNMETNESVKLIDYINCDLDVDNVRNIYPLEDGNFFCLNIYYDDATGNQKFELVNLKKTEASQISEKKIIKMAMMYLDWNVRSRIIEFNKTNSEYRIEVANYEEFNTADDYTAGITKLNTEITSGNIPDIFCLSTNMPIDKYASKGIFEDLTPYLEKDFGKNAMVEGFYNALTTDDGKLYELYSSFNITTYYGLKKVVGDGTSWTYKDMQDALATLQPGATIFEPYYDRTSAISIFLSTNIGSYVDWETGDCHFDSEDFIGLLEAIKSFPKEYDWENADNSEVSESTISRLTSGKQLLGMAYMYDVDSLRQDTWYQTEEELSFVGLPTNDGTGSSFETSGTGFAISSSSQYKDAAWDFIKEVFTEEYFQQNGWGIPANKKIYDAQFEQAMTPNFPEEVPDTEGGSDIATEFYYANGGGVAFGGGYMPENLVVLNDKFKPAVNDKGIEEEPRTYYYSDQGQFAVYAMTQEERDIIEGIINSTKSLARYDTSLQNIVAEECEAFFNDQKSAADTAQMIQSRVKLYVNEQK